MNQAARDEYRRAMMESGEWNEFQPYLKAAFAMDNLSNARRWDVAKDSYDSKEPVESLMAGTAAKKPTMSVVEFVESVAGIPDGTVAQAIQWVAATLNIRFENIPTDSVPGPVAANLLDWAKSNKDGFYLGPFTKLLPNKAQLEEREAFKDDGRELDELEDFLLRARREAEENREGGG